MEIKWKKYYYRVIGFALSGAGFGLIADEIIQGTIEVSLMGHETLGLFLFILGLFLISRKPRGKE